LAVSVYIYVMTEGKYFGRKIFLHKNLFARGSQTITQVGNNKYNLGVQILQPILCFPFSGFLGSQESLGQNSVLKFCALLMLPQYLIDI
jgi:hypothetical protein